MPKSNGNLARLKQSQQKKRSNLADWWANQFAELDLPSGLHVVVREVDLEDLMANGTLPNTLMKIFPEFQNMSDEEATKKMMEEHPDSFSQMVNAVAQACLLEPRIGQETDIKNGVLSLADLRGKDKNFLFEWANREVKQVSPFRDGEAERSPNP